MDIREISIIYHVGIVLTLLWICSTYNCHHPFLYFISLIYLYQVHEGYIVRLRKKLQFEERKQATQKRLLSDSETVRWLNHAVEKVWPICMEQIASQQVLLPIIPWFLDKFKPWTAKKAVVQHLYLGRTPPLFTEIRVLRHSTDDDHLVLELGMNFLTADDMSAILAVKLRRRLGFGMWAKLHVTGMHIEGKVLVGVKFLREWPFLGRLRVCFVEPPYFQMTVKPIVSHGLDVTELPGIAGWLDKLLSVAFEQTLVEPNMLVVDMEKFASASTESWFTVDEKDPIAYVKVEVIEAADMKPSDPNGLADPYVKGQLGPYRFRTKTQKKTLTPKWQEEFKISICTWESLNTLVLEVRDKDHFVDDTLGNCSININDMRDGQRHDMWLALKNIKMGRLHVAISVLDVNERGGDSVHDDNSLSKKETTNGDASETVKHVSDSTGSSKKDQELADDFEPINIEGQQQTGIWVHRPGSDVCQTWEPRKRSRQADITIQREDTDSIASPSSGVSGPNNNCNSSSDENVEGNISKLGSVRRSLRKIGSVFQKSPKMDDVSISGEPSPTMEHVNLRAVNERGTRVNIVRDSETSGVVNETKNSSPEANGETSPGKSHMRGMAKSILKHAEHGFKHVLSRKGSRKSRGEPSETCSQKSDSSEESLVSPSIQYKPTVADVSTDYAPVYMDRSPDSKEQIAQIAKYDSDPKEDITETTVCDTPIKIVEPIVKNVSFQDREDKASPVLRDEVLAKESLNATTNEKSLEENR
ncbi:C2 domain-containing protein [Thalictrum thalictroides]|uniref:C2 domain-containing protein n=1 Tax=Thalictrum thalictroides TaxID=46969 RepID=A0A7J6X5L1_THATH|nr:C2 domain-containing protein [Thalictrum thalictroides]